MPGAVIFRGPSRIDGQPIVVVAVWESTNDKTGNMLQTYIMRSDIDPLTANKLGEDYSICGNCNLRGTPTLDPDKKQAEDRACYVVLYQGPLAVWKGLLRGIYPDATTPEKRKAISRGREVRIGTYGDGAAAPDFVWDDVLEEAEGHTAYSHNGGDPERYMMSADSLEDAEKYWAKGYRTYRIVRDESEMVKAHEAPCPAPIKGVKCTDCLLCGGTSIPAKSIAIVVHGPGAKHF